MNSIKTLSNILHDSFRLKQLIIGTPPFFTDGTIFKHCVRSQLIFCVKIAISLFTILGTGGMATPKVIKLLSDNPFDTIKFIKGVIIPAIITDNNEIYNDSGEYSIYFLRLNEILISIFEIDIYEFNDFNVDELTNSFSNKYLQITGGKKQLINNCAPDRKFHKNTDCLKPEELLSFIKVHSTIPVNSNISENQLYELALHISKNVNNCDKLKCIQDEQNKYIPKYPYGNNEEWLSNRDIDSVLSQYEKQFKYFKYVGAFPINSVEPDCIYNTLCSLSIKDLMKENKNCFGVVFNTARHDENGQHWVAAFCRFSKQVKKINFYYFDSVGIKPTKIIMNWVTKLKKEMKDYEFNFNFNALQHQNGNNQCGMYVIHFIIRMLFTVPFKKFISETIPDDLMSKYRKIYMRGGTNKKNYTREYEKLIKKDDKAEIIKMLKEKKNYDSRLCYICIAYNKPDIFNMIKDSCIEDEYLYNLSQIYNFDLQHK